MCKMSFINKLRELRSYVWGSDRRCQGRKYADILEIDLKESKPSYLSGMCSSQGLSGIYVYVYEVRIELRALFLRIFALLHKSFLKLVL